MLKYCLSSMLFFITLSYNSFAQNQASINEQMIIQIDNETETLKDAYVIDISSLNFQSEIEAESMFTTASNHNVVSFDLDYSNQIVTLFLNKENLLEEYKNIQHINKMLTYYASRLRNLKND